MTGLVLDNSVSMRWLLQSEKASDQHYAEAILRSLSDTDALAPNLWHLEAANVLLNAQRHGLLTTAAIEHFIAQLELLPIYVDPLTANHALGRTLSLASAYKLSSYDAAYLELAIREGLPLATLDKDLRRAATKAGVAIYQQ